MNEVIKQVVQAKAKLLTHAAECIHYNFTQDYFKKVYQEIVEKTPKLKVSDIKTKEDLEVLEMNWHINDVILIPLCLIDFFNPNESVVCFLDKTTKQVKDITDLDNRCGYLAYGIHNNCRR